jgi:hypothetical protein
VKLPRVRFKEGKQLKKAAIQGGLEYGSRRITIVRRRYQETSNEDIASW